MNNDMIKVMLDKRSLSLFANWGSRQERSDFVASAVKKLNVSSVLNIGSGGKRQLVCGKNVHQVDVDFQGDVDIELNLDTIPCLPCEDNEFDLVCGMDVLEHLENFHLIANEMVRCANNIILVSLPNSAAEIPNIVLRPSIKRPTSYQGYYSKYYGLPLEKHLDRHRHWIYTDDIIRYFEHLADKYNLEIQYILPSFSFKLRLIRGLLGKRLFYTFFLSHVCILMHKRSVES
jgi:hypothetical protein